MLANIYFNEHKMKCRQIGSPLDFRVILLFYLPFSQVDLGDNMRVVCKRACVFSRIKSATRSLYTDLSHKWE